MLEASKSSLSQPSKGLFGVLRSSPFMAEEPKGSAFLTSVFAVVFLRPAKMSPVLLELLKGSSLSWDVIFFCC